MRSYTSAIPSRLASSTSALLTSIVVVSSLRAWQKERSQPIQGPDPRSQGPGSQGDAIVINSSSEDGGESDSEKCIVETTSPVPSPPGADTGRACQGSGHSATDGSTAEALNRVHAASRHLWELHKAYVSTRVLGINIDDLVGLCLRIREMQALVGVFVRKISDIFPAAAKPRPFTLNRADFCSAIKDLVIRLRTLQEGEATTLSNAIALEDLTNDAIQLRKTIDDAVLAAYSGRNRGSRGGRGNMTSFHRSCGR